MKNIFIMVGQLTVMVAVLLIAPYVISQVIGGVETIKVTYNLGKTTALLYILLDLLPILAVAMFIVASFFPLTDLFERPQHSQMDVKKESSGFSGIKNFFKKRLPKQTTT